MIKRRRNSIFFSAQGGLLFILLLAAAMPGCKKDPPPPPPPKAKPLPAKAAPVQPAKPVQAAVSSARSVAAKESVQAQLSTVKKPALPNSPSLDFTGKRDPFKPYAQMPLPQQAGSAKRRIRDPLPIQSFETERFKVSGIVTGLKENSALVLDPNNKGYVVKAGMPLGSNDGYVKRITANSVEVEESFRDDNGRVRKRLVKLTLLRKK